MKVTKNVGFLLTVLVSSLFLPVSSSRFFWRKDVLATPEIVQAGMMEYITVESDGTCTLNIIMNVSSSFLVDIYKRAFGYNSSYSNGIKYSVPQSINVVRYQNFAWNHSEIDKVYENPILEVDGRIYPRDSLCNGTFQQQLLCLGIEITDFSSVEMMYNGDVFFTYINASGFFVQYGVSGGNSTVCVGPSNWNMSCDRANLVLTEIGFIQQMLGEYSGEQIYHNNWITAITPTTAITNLDDPNYWNVTFGGGTSIEATTSLSGNTVMLVEDMRVSEENITKTEHQLLEEERFLCYKIFNIKYTSGLGCCVSRCACVDDLTWGFDLPSFTIRFPMAAVKFSDPDDKVSVDFRFNFSLTVTGHVQLKTKWFKFRKFEAWLQAEGDLWAKFNASCNVNFKDMWERDLCKWTTNNSRPYTFWVGPVPVVVRPRIRVIARLDVDFKGTAWISCEARTDGLIRLGAGWKRHKGFYGIFKAGMTVTEFKPDCGGTVDVTVTPSVGFRPSLLFYETVGPAVELEPYLEVHWYDHGGGNWENDTLLGINVSVGIDFSGWIKKITGLHDYDWTIRDWVLWEYPNREQHDVAVTDVRIPPEAVYNDVMNVSVFVLNVGKSDENIEVTLSYDDGSRWVAFDCVENPKQIVLPARDYATVNFTCYTEGMAYTDDPGGTPYPVMAEAVITPDDDDSNNRCMGEFNLTYLNVAIIDLTSYWSTSEYKIDVTVRNTGTTNASAVPIFVYANGEPISDVWCEAMTIMFDLQPKQQRTYTFHSDTNESLTAQIPLLLYETITLDNKWPRIPGDVNDDGIVELKDFFVLSEAFGSKPGHPNWNPNADVYPWPDGDCIIELKDFFFLSQHFGQTL